MGQRAVGRSGAGSTLKPPPLGALVDEGLVEREAVVLDSESSVIVVDVLGGFF
jgi:hypothetical protein